MYHSFLSLPVGIRFFYSFLMLNPAFYRQTVIPKTETRFPQFSSQSQRDTHLLVDDLLCFYFFISLPG